jgi:hypothetical protein
MRLQTNIVISSAAEWAHSWLTKFDEYLSRQPFVLDSGEIYEWDSFTADMYAGDLPWAGQDFKSEILRAIESDPRLERINAKAQELFGHTAWRVGWADSFDLEWLLERANIPYDMNALYSETADLKAIHEDLLDRVSRVIVIG